MSVRWVLFCKRTEDPKLAWLERALAARGIRSRRRGHSWHAPILEVPATQLDAADAFLAAPFDGRPSLDDIPDDDPLFTGGDA